MAGEFSSHGADDTGGNTGGSQNCKKLGSKTPKIAFFLSRFKTQSHLFSGQEQSSSEHVLLLKFIDLN